CGEGGSSRARVAMFAVGSKGLDAEELANAARRAVVNLPLWVDVFGLTFSAAWVEDVPEDDEPMPSGTDSARSTYRLDAVFQYQDNLF
ncbi:MAG: hypothetical protein JWM16_6194, partial [Verrucomicrobiales bacterium]|nr:hypothetical protein [Verrucomicrobiales bacterium]